MRTLLYAYHDIGCMALKTLKEMGEDVCAVFTHEDDPGENLWFGSVKKLAESYGIPVFTPEDPNGSEWIQKIKALKPDILYSFYYRKMISDCILAIPPKGGLNLHGSLLPKFRGRAPINWVLVKGETETGVTLHYMVKKPDAGDIVAQRRVAIGEEDTAHSLYQKLVPLVRDIVLETVPKLTNGTAPRIPQNHAMATYFSGRKPSDGLMDWTKPSKEIYNLIRAVTHPYPGAFTFLDGTKILVWWGKKTDKRGAPGTVIAMDPLTVACGQGALILERVQPEGAGETSGTQWAKDRGLTLGATLGRPGAQREPRP